MYKERRNKLAERMRQKNQTGLILLPGNVLMPRNYQDNTYCFRQDSNFLYFFGIALPDCTGVIDIETGAGFLFYDLPDESLQIWIGVPSYEAIEQSGLQAVYPKSKLASYIADKPVHFLPQYNGFALLELSQLLCEKPELLGKRVSLALIQSVIAMRQCKELGEISEIERAVNTTISMHKEAIRLARPGTSERDIMAGITAIALQDGDISFQPIVTVHGEILHNHAYDKILQSGQLLLVDAGAETCTGYAGDLTTTLPVNGVYSPEQREIYEIVLKAGSEAAALLKPGFKFKDAHVTACRVIAEGLSAIGILKGSSDDIVAEGAHALFFPHGLGHMMGLDVHDMEGLGEDYVGYDREPRSTQFGLRSLRLAKALQANMVVTIEPGIYFIPLLIAAWKKENRHANFINYNKLEAWLSFGGIRNEEDWLITETGARRLGAQFDKSSQAIESLYKEELENNKEKKKEKDIEKLYKENLQSLEKEFLRIKSIISDLNFGSTIMESDYRAIFASMSDLVVFQS